MNKRGFTLVELIGTIVILLVLSLLVFPNLLNLIKNSKKDISASTKDFIYGQAKSYIYDNVNSYTLKEGNIYCIGLKDLVSKNYLNTPLKDAESGNDIDLSKQIEVKVNNNDYSYELVETCIPKSYYTDNSGANTPKLFNNMVPIKYENNKWLVADLYSKWYDYNSKQWANAVVLNSGVTKNAGDEVTEEDVALWYVWLPRYKYKKFSKTPKEQEISVTFEKGTSTTGTGENVTHPAFTFGNTELTGFWVGKFEISTTDSACNSSATSANCDKVLTMTIKPNVSSWRYATISNHFTSIQNATGTYGINNADSHMLKNIEWGAVAYLKQSKYGLGTTDIAVNTNSNFYTGGGTSDAYKTNVAQSTTGNIYGVYDMSGGAVESVMGNYNDIISMAGFSSMPAAKYYDKYTSSTGKTGDATTETSGWYGDSTGFLDSSFTWYGRGGDNASDTYAGLFAFDNCGGADCYNPSARAVLSAQ